MDPLRADLLLMSLTQRHLAPTVRRNHTGTVWVPIKTEEKDKENSKCQGSVIGSYVPSGITDEHKQQKQPTGDFPPLTTGQLPTHETEEEVL